MLKDFSKFKDNTPEKCSEFIRAILDNRLLKAIGGTSDLPGIIENRKIMQEFMDWDDSKSIEDYEELERESDE